MELYQELLVTAVISILIAFIVAKLAALSDAADRAASPGLAAAAGEGASESRVVCREEPVDDVVVESDRVELDHGVAEPGRAEEIAGEAEAVAVGEVEGVSDEVVVERREGEGEEEGSLLVGEDEWEGIERSEVEELFGVATAYVNSVGGANAVAALSGDLQMELYGLQKVATEGPCREAQPLALKVSARARWHAWQRLGNMNPEVAMEQYITLLSDNIPGWKAAKSGGGAEQDEGNDPHEKGLSETGTSYSSSSLHNRLSNNTERLPKDSSSFEDDNSSAGPKLSDQGLAKILFLNLLSPTTMRFLIFYW